MKCPKCSLVTFDHLQQCPRCETSFSRARRLTRARPRGRRIVISRPGAEVSSAPATTPEERQPSSPRAAQRAPGLEQGPADNRPSDRPEPAGAAGTTPEGVRAAARVTSAKSEPPPARPTAVEDEVVDAAAPPSRQEHAADAAGIKARMIRASQARRQRDQVLAAEVDPVLPDWYEPESDTEADEPARPERAARR